MFHLSSKTHARGRDVGSVAASAWSTCGGKTPDEHCPGSSVLSGRYRAPVSLFHVDFCERRNSLRYEETHFFAAAFLVAKVAAGKEAFTPMMEEFRDIDLYLSNDLTSAGVASVKPLAAKAAADAKKAKDALGGVMAELLRIQAELSPTLAG